MAKNTDKDIQDIKDALILIAGDISSTKKPDVETVKKVEDDSELSKKVEKLSNKIDLIVENKLLSTETKTDNDSSLEDQVKKLLTGE